MTEEDLKQIQQIVDRAVEPLRIEVESLGTRVESLGTNVASLETNVASLGTKVESIGTDVESLGANIESLRVGQERAVESLKLSQDRAVESLIGNISDLRNEMNHRFDETDRRIDAATIHLDRIDTRLAALDLQTSGMS